MVAKTFASALEALRLQKGLSRSQLADKIDISTPYLALLEHPDPERAKLPSVELLRAIVEEFSDQSPEAVFDLMVAAANPKMGQGFIAPRGWISTESVLQQKEDFSNKWIVTDKIGETENDELFQTTVEKINDGARYVYFIPRGSFQFAYLKERFESHDRITKERLMQSVMCIQAPSIMFFSRLAIWFNEQLTATDTFDGSIGVGPLNQTVFYQIPPSQVLEIGGHLSPVVRFFRMYSDAEKYSSPTGDTFDRVFPPVVK